MKKALLKILALCLCIATALSTFVACVPDGNNKCDHEWEVDYTKPYTEPTRTTDGKEWYVCGLCGQTKQEKVDKLRYLNGLEQSYKQQFGIVLKDFSVVSTNTSYYQGVKESYSKNVVKIDFYELYLDIDENGKFDGYGYVDGVNEYLYNYGQEVDSSSNDIKTIALVEDSVVYIKVK